MTKLDAGLITSLPASDPGSAAVWGSKRINPRPQFCLCLAWSGCPSNDDDDDHDLVDSRSEEYSLQGAKYYDTASTVRLFEPPTLDLTVNSYYKMVNLTSCHQQPPVIEHLTDLDIEQCRIRPLQLDHPCHNQCVERHVKMVTEAAAQVEGFERRDGLIRQKIKSRKLLKKFDTKVQF